jgi:hypothetical protein
VKIFLTLSHLFEWMARLFNLVNVSLFSFSPFGDDIWGLCSGENVNSEETFLDLIFDLDGFVDTEFEFSIVIDEVLVFLLFLTVLSRDETDLLCFISSRGTKLSSLVEFCSDTCLLPDETLDLLGLSLLWITGWSFSEKRFNILSQNSGSKQTLRKRLSTFESSWPSVMLTVRDLCSSLEAEVKKVF